MIDSRRCPNAMGPWATTPSESGPRDAMASVIRATAATSADRPSKRISPQIPHTLSSVPLGRCLLIWPAGPYPGVLATTAGRRIDDPGPVSRDPGQSGRHDLGLHPVRSVRAQMHEGAQVDVMWVHALPVECGMGGQGDRLLGDETFGLGLKFASTSIQRFRCRLRTDDDPDAPKSVDRLDHQLGEMVDHVIALRAFGADPRRYLRECRPLAEVVLDHGGYVGVDRLVVGNPVAERVG